MFPDVRLMIAAVLASIAALSAGFAIFAAFRVNHDPLVRLPAGATPYQLVSETMVPPAASFAADPSLSSRSPLDQPMMTGTVTSRPASRDNVSGVEPPPIAAGTQKPDQDGPDQPAAAAPVAALTAAPVAAAPVVPVDSIDAPPPTASSAAPPANPAPETAADVPPQAPAAEASPLKEAVQELPSEDASAPASDAAQNAKAHAPEVRAVARKVARKRAHVRVARAPAAEQTNAQAGQFPQYPLPNNQGAQYIPFGEQPAQPAKRRLVLKIVSRRAPAKAAKPAPTSQSAVGGPAVAAPVQ